MFNRFRAAAWEDKKVLELYGSEDWQQREGVYFTPYTKDSEVQTQPNEYHEYLRVLLSLSPQIYWQDCR